MGYTNVSLVQRSSSARDDNPITRCANEFYHVNVERWTSGYDDLAEKYVKRLRQCEDLGRIGYVGRNGMYVNQHLVDKARVKGFIEFYKTFVNDSSYWDSVEGMKTSPVGKCMNVGICNDLDPSTGNNRYLSTECVKNPSACKTVYMIKDTWGSSVMEGWSEVYSLPFAFEYYGTTDVQQKALAEAFNAGLSTIAYQWTPTLGSVAYNLTRVVFPESNSDCFTTDRSSGSISTATCDFPSEQLYKAVWGGLKNYDYPAYRLVQKFSIGEGLIGSLLKTV